MVVFVAGMRHLPHQKEKHKSGQLKCDSLTSGGDVYDCHELFFSNTDSNFQDDFLLKIMQVNAVVLQ